jgi:5-(aminomethyl)-3-furanmethanol phosphate kinase
MKRPLTVVKVGGSLFDWPELRERLGRWLADAIPADHRILLVPGGGPTMDVFRALDRCHGLGEEKAHFLALRALTLNAWVLADLLGGVPVIEDPGNIEEEDSRRLWLLDAHAFFHRDEEQHGQVLPHTWEVTSDSLAARTATALGAAGLVLLKSTSIPPGQDWDEAGRLGLVDPHFAGLVREAKLLDVRAIDLREWRPSSFRQ